MILIIDNGCECYLVDDYLSDYLINDFNKDIYLCTNIFFNNLNLFNYYGRFSDINNKIIRLINPIRTIKYLLKYNFNIDNNTKKHIINNLNNNLESTNKYVLKRYKH